MVTQKKIIVNFISNVKDTFWLRQFRNHNNEFNNIKYLFNDDVADPDYLVVYDTLKKTVKTLLPPERCIFVAPEPINIKKYNNDFLQQFGTVLTTDKNSLHENKRLVQVGLPWHLGVWDERGQFLKQPMSFDELQNFRPNKTKLISVISSNKAFTPEHKRRLNFVRELKTHFGDQIDFFGRGINTFGDKLEALKDYRYHIALENCTEQHYWTEKLADPFLTLTYPIYYGCPNVSDYFPEKSFTAIDIENLEQSFLIIKKVMESDLAETAQKNLEEARKKVLFEHNIFSLLSNIVAELNVKNELNNRGENPYKIKMEDTYLPFGQRIKKIIIEKISKVFFLRTVLVFLRNKLSKNHA